MLVCMHSPPLLLAACKFMDHLNCSSNLPMHCKCFSVDHLIHQNKTLRLSQVIPLCLYLTAEERGCQDACIANQAYLRIL